MKGLQDAIERGEGGANVQVPAEIAVYVEELGADLAVRLFLELGGAGGYFAEAPNPQSRISQLIGPEAVARIARRLKASGRPEASRQRLPTAKPWIARYLHAEGWSIADIARTLHTTDVTVRKYLRPSGTAAAPTLFDWAANG